MVWPDSRWCTLTVNQACGPSRSLWVPMGCCYFKRRQLTDSRKNSRFHLPSVLPPVPKNNCGTQNRGCNLTLLPLSKCSLVTTNYFRILRFLVLRTDYTEQSLLVITVQECVWGFAFLCQGFSRDFSVWLCTEEDREGVQSTHWAEQLKVIFVK